MTAIVREAHERVKVQNMTAGLHGILAHIEKKFTARNLLRFGC